MAVDSPAFTNRTVFGTPIFLLQLIFADIDTLTAYEERLQLTVQSFLLWTILLFLPVYTTAAGMKGIAGV